MENCCKKRRDILGTFKGDEKAKGIEYKQYEKLLKTTKRIVKIPLGEELVKCKKCGQYWVQTYEGEGHGEHEVLRKITFEDAQRKFPDLKLD